MADRISPQKMRLFIFILSLVVHLFIITGVKLNSPPTPQAQPTGLTPITLVLLKQTLQPVHVTAPDLKQQPPKASPKRPAAEPISSIKPAPIKRPSQKTLPSRVSAIVKSSSNLFVPSSSVKPEKSEALPKRLKDAPVKVNKPTTPQAPPIKDWNAIAKDLIHERFDKEIQRDKLQEELRVKAPSDMYGKPKYFFAKQDKKAMLVDEHDLKKKSIFPVKKKKQDGNVIQIGKLCFKGLTAAEEYDLETGKSGIGSLIPFKCDF